MKKPGGFGMVLLLVVLVIVLLLSARAWRSVAPTALDVVPQLSGNGDAPSANRHEPVRGAGHIPDLNEMRRNTSQHADRIQDLQDQID